MKNPFQLIQKLDDGTHDIEATIDLPKRSMVGSSIVVRCSRADGKTTMTISHEVEGDHEFLKEFKITDELFDKLATT
jgi:hypothetical protein